MITMTIPGKPISKARPRFFRRGNFVGTYNSQMTEEGKFIFQVQSKLPPGFKPVTGPCLVELCFEMPIPKSAKKHQLHQIEQNLPWYHDKKPDIDNLVKFVLDSIRNIIISDDASVSSLRAVKRYGYQPSTQITVEAL